MEKKQTNKPKLETYMSLLSCCVKKNTQLLATSVRQIRSDQITARENDVGALVRSGGPEELRANEAGTEWSKKLATEFLLQLPLNQIQ